MSNPNPVPAPSLTGEPESVNNEDPWKIYSLTNEMIRFADTKAGAIFAANGLVCGLVIQGWSASTLKLPSAPGAARLFLLMGAMAVLISIVACFWCLIPRTAPENPDSPLFFGSIATKESAQVYKQQIKERLASPSGVRDALAEQIWEVSRIATEKYLATRIGLWAFIVALGAFGLMGLFATP
jgi:hypothetical protein